MGFTEILIIAVIAILFLGPDKLPGAMVEIAKFFRSAKNAIGSVKDTLEEEMNVSEIKKEALSYKKELLNAQSTLNKVTDVKGTVGASLANMTDDILADDEDVPQTKKAATTPEEVTFKKKKQINKEENIDV